MLLIKNNSNEEVEVHEADEINFFQVKQHLQNGGSVFITSKDSQKQLMPKAKSQLNYTKSRETQPRLHPPTVLKNLINV